MSQTALEDGPVIARAFRGDALESVHRGHAVVVDAKGAILAAFGNPALTIFPRSSCKMLQALPLAERFDLPGKRLALACASHNGAPCHTDGVARWLAELGLGERDLLCGAQMPRDPEGRAVLGLASPCQLHNNCSGKHAGFLALRSKIGGDADYVDPDHPVQQAVRAAFEEMTGETSPYFGIDGCSAPNFACTLHGLARAMAKMAAPAPDARGKAAARLVAAMAEHPVLVAGEGRACTELMRAMQGTVIKTGAEGVFVGILPEQGIGIALKAADGATRAAEAAIAALLVALGVLDPKHPAAQARLAAPDLNRRRLLTGHIKADPELMRPL